MKQTLKTTERKKMVTQISQKEPIEPGKQVTLIKCNLCNMFYEPSATHICKPWKTQKCNNCIYFIPHNTTKRGTIKGYCKCRMASFTGRMYWKYASEPACKQFEMLSKS